MGVYQVFFNVPVSEAGKLELTLNDEPLEYTVVGRTTATSDIICMFLVETTSINSILTVRNPSENSTALTITPSIEPASAHLIIKKSSNNFI